MESIMNKKLLKHNVNILIQYKVQFKTYSFSLFVMDFEFIHDMILKCFKASIWNRF